MHTWTDTAPLDNAYRNLDRALLDSNIPDDTLGAIDTLSGNIAIESERQGFIQGFALAVRLLAECMGGGSIE